MKGGARWWAVLREALATARSQPIASSVAVLLVAGMCATILLTTGRTVGAEQSVLGSIDAAGTRSIVVRAEPDAGLTSDVLQRLAMIDGIEWAGAFSIASDASNVSIPGGAPVPLRLAWGSSFEEIGIGPGRSDDSAWAAPETLEILGVRENVGGVVTPEGASYSVGNASPSPAFIDFLEPLIIVPQEASAVGQVSVLIVIAERPDLVEPVADAVVSVLSVGDPAKVKLTTSEGLADLRALVAGTLGDFSRDLVLVVFAVTAVLVAGIFYALVMMRRKDFGRRRALGASRGLIVAMLLVQVVASSIAGSVIGSSVAAAALVYSDDPLPGPDFFVAVAALAVLVTIVAALPPAILAANRDPLKELRVP